ncbi:hypothetical protein EHI8A_038950 [Entamoeba histolytica HM-1:IMSS-B]|uniref:Uncharacterized protein n=6 Tax=Entamoeba histolytica TaxID=5759 RepID=C4M2P3_ENTH1|nr:hypothetical protein EHI_006090 [Entamoeba histolytica HM-1:IMSS]EMD48053.1 Hypothetical protein EHI5A_034600 [Entamoeba histolytica KU27]EMH75070.1 hypothetical protein EHI8A_038950 [Entamoeba histolytica HM-1:IMSS-B]EMS11513.1 hypothetical protein KM1_043050 [Entamoeba histolytica HM-3:IMSS]ENY63178.1 hypothetical protein EHI7A_017840 [Entamoeba histolytica HM-1:IMSS-A]GAT95552.1 hypothetical protein CL6EHI_006090 [Entamoeba histolytica]|eukprot:XP_653432.1 hypothetical protein EHI_006090 [Entamoeba histolytica HM-1:IMSS]
MQSSFISDYSTKQTYDDYMKVIKQLLSSNAKDIYEHWGIIWASLRMLLEMTPGTLGNSKIKISNNNDDVIKSKYLKQIHIIDLSEQSQINFQFSLNKETIFQYKDFMKISQNQSFTINRFNVFSKALKSEIGQLIQTHSPITYTFVLNYEKNSATVLHLIYLPILRISNQSPSPFYLVCITIQLPIPHKEVIEESVSLQPSETSQYQNSSFNNLSLATDYETILSDISSSSPIETQIINEEEKIKTPEELDNENRKKVYERQQFCLQTMQKFENIKGLSIYKQLLELLTDSINMMIFNATLIIFRNISIQNYKPENAKKLSIDYINDMIRNISESFDVAVNCIYKPIEPIYDPDQQIINITKKPLFRKEKKNEYPFSSQFISMVLTAHLETYFTIVLAQSDKTKNFFHSLFYSLNPPQFTTTSNNPFTCFPFFVPRRNWFVKAIFLTELEQRSLYDIPLPYCVINCQTMQVAISKSSSMFEHFCYRATAQISIAAKALQCQFPISAIPPDRSLRLLQRSPTTENISTRLLYYYYSNQLSLSFIEICKFLEYYQQKARIVLSIIKTEGINMTVLTELEELFQCNSADEMMLILSFLKSDYPITAQFYALIEKKVRIDY